MNLENEKSVMIIDEALPLGIIANTAAILGITLGKKRPDIVGCDVTDQNGNVHLGIIAFPIPVLKGTKDSIREIRQRLYTSDSVSYTHLHRQYTGAGGLPPLRRTGH